MIQLPLLFAQQTADAVQDRWADDFFGLGADERFVVLIVALGCATAVIISVTAMIAGVYTSATRRQAEAELKQDMLDRGMSASEIAEVIEATPPSDFADRWVKAKCKKR